jgi:hypothetical protein
LPTLVTLESNCLQLCLYSTIFLTVSDRIVKCLNPGDHGDCDDDLPARVPRGKYIIFLAVM